MAKEQIEAIKFLKIRDVKSPSRAYKYDAGIDFYVPKFNAEFIKDLKSKNPDVFKSNSVGCCDNPYISGTITFSGSTSNVAVPKPEVKYDMNDTNDSIIKFDDNECLNYFNLPPHSRIMIPSGINSRMANPGRALIATNKSGIATKHGLVVGATTVDYTYTGEIHLSLINTSTKLVRIYEDMKIIQFIETPVFFSNIEIADSNNKPVEFKIDFYKDFIDDRGSDGFGSTNKK